MTVSLIRPVYIEAFARHSIEGQVLIEPFVLLLVKRLQNRLPLSWRGVGRSLDEVRHTYVYSERRM